MKGLTVNENNIIREIITKIAPNCDIIAFGSRVDGTHHDTSDLDLAFITPNGVKLSLSQIGGLKESDLTFRIDVIDYNDVEQYFRDIIDAGGVRFWSSVKNCFT